MKLLIFSVSALSQTLSQSVVLFHSFETYQTRVLFQDGSFIEPSNVFRIYIEKLFWEGEQKAKESEVDQPVSNRSSGFSLPR